MNPRRVLTLFFRGKDSVQIKTLKKCPLDEGSCSRNKFIFRKIRFLSRAAYCLERVVVFNSTCSSALFREVVWAIYHEVDFSEPGWWYGKNFLEVLKLAHLMDIPSLLIGYFFQLPRVRYKLSSC